MEQRRDPTDRNRIRGSCGRTSERLITKSISVKGHRCKFGGCGLKAGVLTLGGLRRVPTESGLRKSRGLLIASQKSAEGIVVPMG